MYVALNAQFVPRGAGASVDSRRFTRTKHAVGLERCCDFLLCRVRYTFLVSFCRYCAVFQPVVEMEARVSAAYKALDLCSENRLIAACPTAVEARPWIELELRILVALFELLCEPRPRRPLSPVMEQDEEGGEPYWVARHWNVPTWLESTAVDTMHDEGMVKEAVQTPCMTQAVLQQPQKVAGGSQPATIDQVLYRRICGLATHLGLDDEAVGWGKDRRVRWFTSSGCWSRRRSHGGCIYLCLQRRGRAAREVVEEAQQENLIEREKKMHKRLKAEYVCGSSVVSCPSFATRHVAGDPR